MGYAASLAAASQQQHLRYFELYGAQPVTGEDLADVGTEAALLARSLGEFRDQVIASDFSTSVVPAYESATAGDQGVVDGAADLARAAAEVADISRRINIEGAAAVSRHSHSEASEVSAIPDPDSPTGLLAVVSVIERYQAESLNSVVSSSQAEVAAANRMIGDGGGVGSEGPTIQLVTTPGAGPGEEIEEPVLMVPPAGPGPNVGPGVPASIVGSPTPLI